MFRFLTKKKKHYFILMLFSKKLSNDINNKNLGIINSGFLIECIQLTLNAVANLIKNMARQHKVNDASKYNVAFIMKLGLKPLLI